MPVAATHAEGSPVMPADNCVNAVERAGLRQPRTPSASAILAMAEPIGFGRSRTGCWGKPSHRRCATTRSRTVSTCGCTSSKVPRAGSPGPSAQATVAATSSTLTICSRLSALTSGVRHGSPASPRSMAVAP